MDFWELTVILFRRWYVFVPVLLLTLGGTFFLGQRVEPSYEAQASMLVAGPGGELGDGNPFATSETAARALAVIMESPEAITSVSSQTDAPDDVEYTVTNLSHTSILEIYIDAPTAETALQTAQAAVSVIESRLADAQESIGATPSARSKMVTLSPPLDAKPSTEGRMRVLIAGAGVSGLLALTAALALEGLQRRRRLPVAVSGRRARTERAA